jgi:hypothetical protein
MFMFHSWVNDQTEEMERAKNQAYLIGSFINPEAVKQLMGEGADIHKSTDADLEKSMEIIERSIKQEGARETKHRRRRVVDG